VVPLLLQSEVVATRDSQTDAAAAAASTMIRRSASSIDSSETVPTNGIGGGGPSSSSVRRAAAGAGGAGARDRSGKPTTNGRHHRHRAAPALPGRPRWKRRRRRQQQSPWVPLYSLLRRKKSSSGSGGGKGDGVGTGLSSLLIAVVLWYSLGVVSIGTSKLLLTAGAAATTTTTTTDAGGDDPPFLITAGVSPVTLTLQQLIIGSALLRFLLGARFLGSAGLRPWPPAPPPSGSAAAAAGTEAENGHRKEQKEPWRTRPPAARELVLAGAFFSAGFLATNLGFSGSSAAFVETVKAAEPITSALAAWGAGIEAVTARQFASLGTVVAGVLLSTLAGRRRGAAAGGGDGGAATAPSQLRACAVVMVANLCFSFRGLYQKLFRKTAEGGAMDDLNLQFRMQQTGVIILVLPVLFVEAQSLFEGERTGVDTNSLLRYLSLALLNGCAFTGYNLASTYILSRISVVHHAALNCLRRVFAIIVTSILFGIPITWAGSAGILLAVLGFMSYTHYKVQAQQQQASTPLLPISEVKPLLPMSEVK
jgi:drug/metabolite transporter (DMT)-like permease